MTGFVVERFSTGRMVVDHKALDRRVVTERCQSDGLTHGGTQAHKHRWTLSEESEPVSPATIVCQSQTRDGSVGFGLWGPQRTSRTNCRSIGGRGGSRTHDCPAL